MCFSDHLGIVYLICFCPLRNDKKEVQTHCSVSNALAVADPATRARILEGLQKMMAGFPREPWEKPVKSWEVPFVPADEEALKWEEPYPVAMPEEAHSPTEQQQTRSHREPGSNKKRKCTDV